VVELDWVIKTTAIGSIRHGGKPHAPSAATYRHHPPQNATLSPNWHEIGMKIAIYKADRSPDSLS
jgi:hypothetical protein